MGAEEAHFQSVLRDIFLEAEWTTALRSSKAVYIYAPGQNKGTLRRILGEDAWGKTISLPLPPGTGPGAGQPTFRILEEIHASLFTVRRLSSDYDVGCLRDAESG